MKEHLMSITVRCMCLTLLFSATAHADLFVFDPSVTPEGYYLPDVGSGRYHNIGATVGFSDASSFFGVPGVQVVGLEFAQGGVPEDPSSALFCVPLWANSCYNTFQFSLAGSNSPWWPDAGLAVYNVAGDPLGALTGG